VTDDLILTVDEKTDPLRVKIQRSIERLRAHEPQEGYYVADSFGKDSCCILELCKMANVRFDSHHNLTTVDPPELIYFGKKHHPGTIIHKPEMNMFQLIVQEGVPPTRFMRYCCKYLKESGGAGRLVVTGIRWAESIKRSKRRIIEACYKDKSKTFVNAIIDWTTEDVWQFIRKYEIPYCNLYNEGFHRLGCIMCPMQGTRGQLSDAERWPKYKQAYLRAFDRMLQAHPDCTWKTAEEVYNWWIGVEQECTQDRLLPFEDQ